MVSLTKNLLLKLLLTSFTGETPTSFSLFSVRSPLTVGSVDYPGKFEKRSNPIKQTS